MPFFFFFCGIILCMHFRLGWIVPHLFLSMCDRAQGLHRCVWDCTSPAHCTQTVPPCLSSCILLAARGLDTLLCSRRDQKSKWVAVLACPIPPGSSSGYCDGWQLDTSSLPLGTGQGDKNCRTEAFISTRKPVSVAYQHKQRNCLNREPHLEVVQSSHGFTQHVAHEPRQSTQSKQGKASL